MVEETFEPGMTVSLVARRHGVAPNQRFTWRSGEQVVPVGLPQSQVRELQHLQWNGHGLRPHDQA